MLARLARVLLSWRELDDSVLKGSKLSHIYVLFIIIIIGEDEEELFGLYNSGVTLFWASFGDGVPFKKRSPD